MKLKTTILAGLLLLPVLPLHADDTELGKQMEAMNDAYKAFRKETDPAKGAELARVSQEHLLKGFTELPASLAKIPDPAAKAKAAGEYRLMMAKLLVSLVEVEQAFIANDLPAVEKLVESLKSQKKEGHDKFIED